MLGKKLFVILAAVLFCNLLDDNAYAYIDPGTGSYVIQIVIAFLVTTLFLIKSFWIRIKVFFTKLFSKQKNKQ
jgi:hypothetical protein